MLLVWRITALQSLLVEVNLNLNLFDKRSIAEKERVETGRLICILREYRFICFSIDIDRLRTDWIDYLSFRLQIEYLCFRFWLKIFSFWWIEQNTIELKPSNESGSGDETDHSNAAHSHPTVTLSSKSGLSWISYLWQRRRKYHVLEKEARVI